MINGKISKGQKSTIKFDKKSFIIDGKRFLFVGGEFHYFRTPPELWEDRLSKMSRSGANLISTYIPWNFHEPVEGKQIWTGDRDVKRFIELCIKYNLYLIVKPGPYCCAELDFGGHPDWLLSKNIRLRMMDQNYLDYAERWYKKIAEIIDPYLVTNGGNIFCIQIENEYDHLISFGDYGITFESSVAYFEKLNGYMEKYGIDIPKTANEAKFLRGKNTIIDTRTYYPNIPFHHEWDWWTGPFEGNIMDAKLHQPDWPIMILELQTGWFGQYGLKFYMTDMKLTEAVAKSTLMLGASVLNFYMYTGGTTFPFWGARGNIVGVTTRDYRFYTKGRWDAFRNFPLERGGMGVTTTFDFGGSPIREWGEIMPVRYYWIKAFNRFCRDFFSLILESTDTTDIAVIGGGEDVKVIQSASVSENIDLSNENNQFTLLTKKRGDEYLVCIRNHKTLPRCIDLGWKADNKPIVKSVAVNPYETLILPVNVTVEGTDFKILYSTSELAFRKTIDGRTLFGLFGKPERNGETKLSVAGPDVELLYGNVIIEPSPSGTVLKYQHNGINIIRVRNHILLLLEHDLAVKYEETADTILIADTYFVQDMARGKENLFVKTQMRNNSENHFTYLGAQKIQSLKINGETASLKEETQLVKGLYLGRFSHAIPKDSPVSLQWMGGWKVKPDSDEAKLTSAPKDWLVSKDLQPMEKLGLIEHGYAWFVSGFDMPEGASGQKIVYTGNDADRQYIYVNGVLVWGGVCVNVDIDIQDVVKPGRNSLVVLYHNFFHNKSHPHEGAMLKYSGIMASVVIKAKKGGADWEVKVTEFSVRMHLNGVNKGYMKEDFDDKAWVDVKGGKKYILHKELGAILWMRRHFRFQAKPGWKFAVRLTIPEAEQRCIIYVNGYATGWFEAVGPQHDFFIPDSWLKENNTVAILMDGQEGYLVEPELSTYYEAREVDIEMRLSM